MSFKAGEPLPLQEFMRIHQLGPDYLALNDAQRKVYLAELKEAYKDLKKESQKNGIPTGNTPSDNPTG